jgi:Big-like domain-containing protein/fibronectin type III domain protein
MKTTRMMITILMSLVWVAAASALDVKLQWDPNTESDLAGYKVYYGVDGLASPAQLDVKNQTIATIPGLDPDQNYAFAVTAYNTAGLESPFSNVVTALESVLPTVSISNPSNNAKVSNTVEVMASASDNVGVVKVEYYVNGTLKASDSAEPYQYSWDTLAVTPGAYIITAKAYDAVGNVGLSTVSVNVVNDVTPPTISYSTPVQGSSVNGLVTVSCNASDDVGVYKVEFYVNGAMGAAGNTAPYNYQWDTKTVSNGSYTLTAKAYDAAGNVGQSAAVTVTVNNPVPDTTAPIVTAFTMPAMATSLTVAISSFTASDSAGVTGYLVTESAAAPAAGTAGWAATPPTSYTFTTVGTKTLYAWAKDAAGNVSQANTATIILDTTKPTGSLTINGGATLTNSLSAPLTLTANDLNGVTSMQFSKDGLNYFAWEPFATARTVTLLTGDGTKTMYVRFKDSAGNVSLPISDTITLDTTKPTGTILINGGAASTTSASVTLTLAASDLNGVAAMQFSKDGVTFFPYEPFKTTRVATLLPGAGLKTMYVRFKDNAGNVSPIFSSSITRL